MELKAVLFDMGGTIETFDSTRELRLQAMPGIQKYLKDAGIVLGLSDEALMEVITRGIKRYHELSLITLDEYPPERVWREFILNDFEIDPAKLDDIAEKLMVYIENHFYERSMRPEIPEVLRAIQKMRLKIGLISNVNSRGQVRENLEKYQIKHFFDPIVLSSEYGKRKPDPSIFHYAARMMNVPTSSCAYVGDRIARDISGSKKAGYRLAIQIKHDFDHGEEDTGATPDAIIGEMTEVVAILKREMVKPQIEPTSHIQALLFDAGDILYFRPKKDNRFLQFLKELGQDEKWLHLPGKKELTRQAFTGQITQEEFHRGYFSLLGITDLDLIHRGMALLSEENVDLEFFDGVKETLTTLKQNGYLLGIITNTANSISNKLSWFEQGGFGDVWDSIISSVEIGVVKPYSEIYEAALRQLDLKADQAVFVGHRKSELDGAHAAGLATIAFNYDEGAKADYFVDTFPALLRTPLISVASIDEMAEK
jgi:HAD superfamily hydrolase (TIGR01549 family)